MTSMGGENNCNFAFFPSCELVTNKLAACLWQQSTTSQLFACQALNGGRPRYYKYLGSSKSSKPVADFRLLICPFLRENWRNTSYFHRCLIWWLTWATLHILVVLVAASYVRLSGSCPNGILIWRHHSEIKGTRRRLCFKLSESLSWLTNISEVSEID